MDSEGHTIPPLLETDGSEAPTLMGDDDTAPSDGSAGPRLARGASIGRYVVLEELGAGGMGVVYAAYDPKLDRKLAIKLVRQRELGSRGSAGSARLIREAQALAKIAHPNVVNVHDVGTFEESIFVAMEFVDGVTLTAWLEREKPDLRRTVRMFAAAGRGLVAAHAVDVVHRDFKPDNVIVGADGRPRVLDFGLARPVGPGYSSDFDSSEGDSDSATHFVSDLTRQGTILGTPAYMAPEQHMGAEVDPRTDQFAFCVALYEALYSERPFAGKRVKQLARNVCRGKVRPAPAGTKVPAALREVLLRGLSVRSPERYPSMAALLKDLLRDRSAARRRIAYLSLGVVGVASVGVASYTSGAKRTPTACRGAGDAVSSVWNADRRDAASGAFRATDLVYARESWERVETGIDDYAAAWQAEYQQACEATHVHQAQSEEMLDLRNACLQSRLHRLDLLVGLLADADSRLVEKAVQAVHQLPGVGACADLEALQARVRPPEDEGVRAKVDELSDELERADAMATAGKYQDSLDLLADINARAQAIGYLPIQARAQHLLASNHMALDRAGATAEMRHVFALSLEARDDRLATMAAGDIAFHQGVNRRNYAEGKHWVDVARALLGRQGGDANIEVAMLNIEAVIAMRSGSYDEAQSTFERMVELQSADQESPNYGVTLMNLGGFHAERRNFEEARKYMAAALQHTEDVLGPQHPRTTELGANLAALSLFEGRYEHAISDLEQVLERQRDVYGESHSDIARTLTLLAAAHRHLDNAEVAEKLHRDALAMRKALFGEDHPEIVETLRNLAIAVDAQDREPEARKLYEGALVIAKRLGHALDIAGVQGDLAWVLNRDGEHERALEMARASIAVLRGKGGQFDPALLQPTLIEGNALRDLGRIDQALASHEKAAQLGANAGNPADRARTEWALARTLAAAKRMRRAVALARRAKASYELSAVGDQGPLKKVEAFLAKHDPGD